MNMDNGIQVAKRISYSDLLLLLCSLVMAVLALCNRPDAATYATLAAGIIAGLAFNMQRKALINSKKEFAISNQRMLLILQLGIVKEHSSKVRVIYHYVSKQTGKSLSREEFSDRKYEYLYKDYILIMNALEDCAFKSYNNIHAINFKDSCGDDIIIDSSGEAHGLDIHNRKIKELEKGFILHWYIPLQEDWDNLQNAELGIRKKKLACILVEKHHLEDYVMAMCNLARVADECTSLNNPAFDKIQYIRSNLSYFELKLLDECWQYLYAELKSLTHK